MFNEFSCRFFFCISKKSQLCFVNWLYALLLQISIHLFLSNLGCFSHAFLINAKVTYSLSQLYNSSIGEIEIHRSVLYICFFQIIKMHLIPVGIVLPRMQMVVISKGILCQYHIFSSIFSHLKHRLEYNHMCLLPQVIYLIEH